MWDNSQSIIIDTALRLIVAALCGGVIGIERQIKRHAAGFRTHIVICVGAALTMMISQYLLFLAKHGEAAFAGSINSDVSRIGAQVLSGISFLGAGTIIMTGRRHVKGLTTSAGLWAAACIGLAVGAGFYIGAMIACFYIFISGTLFSKIESALQTRSKSIYLYFHLGDLSAVNELIAEIKGRNVTVEGIEFQRDEDGRSSDSEVMVSLRLPPKMQHVDIIAELSAFDYVLFIEEI